MIVNHSTLSAGRDVIAGDPRAPINLDGDTADLNDLLHNVDTDVDREIGGYFFDSIDDIFITGFLTPRDISEPGVRPGDYFFNVFECDIGTAEDLDLVWFHNYLRNAMVPSPDAEFKQQLKLELDQSKTIATDASPHSLKTVARIWDQYRRDETPVIAQLDELSYFTSKVQGSLRELNYIDTDEDNVSKFIIRSGRPPAFDEERQGHLLEILARGDFTLDEAIQFNDLPSIKEEHKYFLEKKLDHNVEHLREEIGYRDELRETWDEFFTDEIEPLIKEHVNKSAELHRAHVHPNEDVDQLIDEEPGLIGRLTGGNDHQSSIETGIDQETERTIEELQNAISSRLQAQIERVVQNRAKMIIQQSDKFANELSESKDYQHYKETE